MKRVLGYSFAGLLLLTTLLTSVMGGFLFERYNAIVLTLSGRLVFVVCAVAFFTLLGVILYRYWGRWRDAAGFCFIAVLLMMVVFYGGWVLSDFTGSNRAFGLYGWFYDFGFFKEIEILGSMGDPNPSRIYFDQVRNEDVRWDSPVRRFHRWLKDL